MDWTGFVKHEFVKHGFVKHGFVKHGFLKQGFVKCIRKSKQNQTIYLFHSYTSLVLFYRPL